MKPFDMVIKYCPAGGLELGQMEVQNSRSLYLRTVNLSLFTNYINLYGYSHLRRFKNDVVSAVDNRQFPPGA